MPVAVKAQSNDPPTRCKTVAARMLSVGDQFHSKGSVLCPQDRVRPLQNQKPMISCHHTQKLLRGEVGEIGDLCSRKQRRIYPSKSGSNSSKSRSSGRESGKPSLIKPFGTMVMQLRPELEWNPVVGATHYLVTLQASDSTEKLEQVVHTGNSLRYPQAWPKLQYGRNYRVTIFAYQKQRIISSDHDTLELLIEEEANLIQDAVTAINQLPLSPVEAAKELDTAYMSAKLFHESINALEKVRQAGQSNHQLNQLLADRYYQVGQSELAASIGVEAQLPTRTKFPQK
ncbi:hypothetical protein [Acaryochloris sp. CCMEE 5410]|uniref:hypothetical protein n=1 Tax=Acaryochloris sp. CCMEE 5410 TaxID=310037 RepID=UPI0002484841|nr:hypothetical protein [Acaryochloris sp. CCMEE 5410]